MNTDISDFTRSLDTRWSTCLGCQPAQLRDGGRHVIARPEWRPEERLPWALTRGPICLFTLGSGWVLSVPHELVDRARRLCSARSFEDLTTDGDQLCQEWFDRLGKDEFERPGVESYPVMCDLVGRAHFRGWSHYTFSYADPKPWKAELDEHVVLITEGNRDHWGQWQQWPGSFCGPRLASTFDVSDAFGFIFDDDLVSVGQVQAYHAEYAWEFGVDTLPAFRNRGFATTVLKSVTAHIISREHVPYHYADIYNTPSLRLPHKLGYDRYCEALVAHRR